MIVMLHQMPVDEEALNTSQHGEGGMVGEVTVVTPRWLHAPV